MMPTPEAAEIQRLLAANDARILSPDLDCGRSIVAKWAAKVAEERGFSEPFAVGALGGTGRGEIAPCSDRDIVFLFEGTVEEPPCRDFVLELQRRTLHGREFRDRFGFSFEAMPYGLADAATLRDKDLNAFLDLAPVHDPGGLVPVFREKIRRHYDPFEHFLHVRSLWRRQGERAGAMAERIDRFDLKNDAIRLFLCGIWALAGREFEHSRTIYRRIAAEDPRELADYEFLLRLRCWIHLRRPPGGAATALGSHEEDVMRFEDFDSFGEWLPEGAGARERFEFAGEVRSRLLGARRRIAAFAKGVIETELRSGRSISPGHPVALGAGGLYHANPETCVTDGDRSSAALSLLLMAQRYELQVDASELLTTFHRAGDWLEPVPELGALFLEPRGSLAATLDFLSRIPGAQERLFPGYERFEASLDERVRTERQILRGPLVREKMRALEADLREGTRLISEAREIDRLTDVAYDVKVEVEAARLSPGELAAVRLALMTKRLPVTGYDEAAREDSDRSLTDRYSSGFSGVPVADYYQRFFSKAGLGGEVLDLARFLVENRRAFGEIATSGFIDRLAEGQLMERCGGDRDRLRALFVFTHVDRHAWESPVDMPDLFFNIRELYAKARMPEDRRFDPKRLLDDAGYADRESQEVLMDFGRDFYDGIYRHYAVRFGPHLLRLAQADGRGKPKAMPISLGTSTILGVAARDDRGIAASISGALWKEGIGLTQAHLFSAMNRGLALDFFHLAPPRRDREHEAEPRKPGELGRLVETAITERLHLSDADEAALPDVARQVTITEWRPTLYRLEATSSGDAGALIYVLCCKACRRLQADIFGLASQSGKKGAWASVYLRLPESLALEDAREVVSGW
ncbi:MAG TPA: hypothetical protein PLA50_08460 [Bacteroidia bacterium]|nr:hypothetical protein [Bacteroidia bacterium]